MAPSKMVNGDAVQSKSIDHLKTFPVIKDSLNSSIGQTALGLAGYGYNTFVAPVQPYLMKPYSFVHPYVKAADSYADAGLSKLEQTVPQVKESTGSLRESLMSLAFLPFSLAGQGKDYAFKTYSDEYQKCGGDRGGLVTPVKALITTGLTVSSDAFTTAADFLGAKKEEAKQTAQTGVGKTQEGFNAAKNKAGVQ